ncbi:MAG: Hsp20 family protein [Absicoccus sp.]|uniref:Hsp20 family protein n=1 Tax=Absicoccus sp. TaxID=2718527 RepID=UPI002A75194B|nr:Hsp20 family protein [Absicoccus sp.]MDY3035051.1 Hsp20 family protein [Absicoccus sp.]
MKREHHNWNDWDIFHESNNMKTDIVEKDGNFIMKVEIPGFEKDEIKVELVNDYLYIKANKKKQEQKTDTHGTMIHQERSNHCSRRYYVGEGYDEDDFKAHFENGMLTIIFPDKRTEDQEKPREIQID